MQGASNKAAPSRDVDTTKPFVQILMWFQSLKVTPGIRPGVGEVS